MKSSSEPNQFHITVGTTPQHSKGLDLTNELRLLKAAILYADKVKFCSVSSSFLLSMLQIGNLTGDQLAEWFVQIAPDEVFARNLEVYRQLKTKKRRTNREMIAYRRIEKLLHDTKEEMRQSLETAAVEAGLNNVIAAIQSGVVELETLRGSNTDEITKQYLDVVGNAVLAGNTYPLFDDMTGNLVRLAIREGKLAPSEVSINRAKQVALSSELLRRLPLFDEVSIDEILDIRRELDKPLVRFRSAIIKFSREVALASWDAQFPLETDQVFREHLEPAVMEIEEACKSNKLIFRLLPDLVDKPIAPATASVLALVLAEAKQLPTVVIAGLGLVAGATASSLRSVQEWRAKNQEIESNQLYFYYQAGKLMSK